MMGRMGRLKTIRDSDKKRGIAALLDACASEPTMRKVLEEEAKALTALGNGLRIRHFETHQAKGRRFRSGGLPGPSHVRDAAPDPSKKRHACLTTCLRSGLAVPPKS
jgi:hypothetical protein